MSKITFNPNKKFCTGLSYTVTNENEFVINKKEYISKLSTILRELDSDSIDLIKHHSSDVDIVLILFFNLYKL